MTKVGASKRTDQDIMDDKIGQNMKGDQGCSWPNCKLLETWLMHLS